MPAKSKILIASREKGLKEERLLHKEQDLHKENHHGVYASKVRDHPERRDRLCCWKEQCWKMAIIPKFWFKVSLLDQLIA